MSLAEAQIRMQARFRRRRMTEFVRRMGITGRTLVLDVGGEARIWESAAGYAPTVGILGAVLGLIHVMENLSDPSRLGAGIAVAFVSTVYGVGLANLFVYPVGNKIKGIVTERVAEYEILTDVFHDMATGDYTRVIEERVACLLAEH